jgi:hypothetical protein
MKKKSIWIKNLAILFAVLISFGCGGGGGGSNNEIEPLTPSSHVITLSNSVVSEDALNGTTIGVLSFDSKEGSTFTFSLLDDAEGRFNINGAELQVANRTLLDYATALLHSITIQATDMNENNFTTSLWIAVTPKVVLLDGRIITVTTASDAENGDVSSVDGIFINPGADGISLREAIAASNNTPGPETIEFAPELKGSVIQVGSSSQKAMDLTGGQLIINGDVDGDGQSDITLDGSNLLDKHSNGLSIRSSHNTIHSLKIIGFPSEGIDVRICVEESSILPIVLSGNKIVDNVIMDCGMFGLLLSQNCHGAGAYDLGWEDTLIEGNRFERNTYMAIYLLAAMGGAKGNRIVNTIIANNTVIRNDGDKERIGITVFTADTASDYEGHVGYIPPSTTVEYSDDNLIQNTIIMDNSIDGAWTGILVTAANMGNQNNINEDVKIVGNTINTATWGLVVNTILSPGSRPTINNMISNVEISRNTIQNVRTGICLGTISHSSSPFSIDEINGNILDSVLLKNNPIKGWQLSDIEVSGPVTNLVIE